MWTERARVTNERTPDIRMHYTKSVTSLQAIFGWGEGRAVFWTHWERKRRRKAKCWTGISSHLLMLLLVACEYRIKDAYLKIKVYQKLTIKSTLAKFTREIKSKKTFFLYCNRFGQHQLLPAASWIRMTWSAGLCSWPSLESKCCYCWTSH